MARTRSARTKGKSRPQNRSRASARAARPGQGAVAAQARPGPGRQKGNGAAATVQPAAVGRPRPGSAKRSEISGPPTWLQLTTLILSLGGLGVSIYLTIVHYSTAVSMACPNTGAINCEKVITSAESTVFGIPVAVLGLAFFVFMVAITSPVAWRTRLRVIHLSRVLSVIVGMAFVLYLIYVEVFRVSAICLWCTSVHVITFALFVLVLLSAAMWGVKETAERSA